MNSRSIYLLYRVLQALAWPVLIFYFQFRVVRNPRYLTSVRQRLGFLPAEYKQTVFGAVWFHAASVGEVLSLLPLMERVRAELPETPLFLSTATLAGYKLACEKTEYVFYAPLDFVFAVRRVLRTIRPSLLVVAETEIWPNLYREADRIGCGVLLINGRISDRALPRYTRYAWFFRHVLRHAARILVQSETMRARFLAAGADPSRIEVAGNLKYDITPREAIPEEIGRFFGGSKVWIAASTSADDSLAEEDVVLSAFAELEGWKLLLAPRKPERFHEAARKLDRAGVVYARRTTINADSSGSVLLLDTIGELGGLFPLADVVFMGGTLADRGGHNVLEPAAFGKPVIVGPHMENFREIDVDFRAAGALIGIQSGAELADAVRSASPDIGQRALVCASARRGAVARVASEILHLHSRCVPRYRRPLPALLILKPLAAAWRCGSLRKRARDLARQRALPGRVISVGNITAGGTGKTPMVLAITEHLNRAGRRPAVLTRGYGRRSHRDVIALAPGEKASPDHTGDEAQIILRAGSAYLGISSNRYASGRLLQEKFGVDVFLLDDGFQHLKLARQLDIVLIDALNPFGDGNLLPLGRLREPLDQLARASAFVITRAEPGRPLQGIEDTLRSHNPHAPIFRSRVVPKAWVDCTSGEVYAPAELPYQRTIAFCGLGNPESFWRVLSRLQIHPLEKLDFGDHHAYTPRELRRLGHQGREYNAEALLTTQKDIYNLCEFADSTVAPLKICWLRIGIEIDNEPEFLRLIDG